MCTILKMLVLRLKKKNPILMGLKITDHPVCPKLQPVNVLTWGSAVTPADVGS